MPAALTLHSQDHNWRVEVEARALNLDFYQSIGTLVSVYRRLRTTSIWGSLAETDWDLTPARLIRIQNIYRSAGHEIAVRERAWRDVAQAQLSEWSVGHPIYFPAGHLPFPPAVAPLEIRKVESIAIIEIDGETLTAAVAATLSPAESATTAA